MNAQTFPWLIRNREWAYIALAWIGAIAVAVGRAT
jgi:hypothetical protein